MTKVIIRHDTAGSICGLEVEGHSGYGVEGEDIVCAAVSALTQTAALEVERLGGKPYISQEDAKLSLDLPKKLSTQDMHDAQVVLKAIIAGLYAIRQQYSKHLTIQEV